MQYVWTNWHLNRHNTIPVLPNNEKLSVYGVYSHTVTEVEDTTPNHVDMALDRIGARRNGPKRNGGHGKHNGPSTTRVRRLGGSRHGGGHKRIVR